MATTATAGAAAIAAGVAGTTGVVTALPDFADVALPDLAELRIGGHDVVDSPLRKRAEALAGAGVLRPAVVSVVGDSLDRADEWVRPGIVPGTGEPPLDAVRRVQADLRSFQDRHRLDALVVVNVSSTEQRVADHPVHASLAMLEEALRSGQEVLPASSLYAYAALDAGFPYVDFTPSTGAALPALEELALARGAPHAGRDGKTGETLVKTALAPMFATRNLRVHSWTGVNLLGGGDGASLADPARRASKVQSKGRALEGILGYETDQRVHIDYVEELGEWKTAWDHVSFEGFLGVAMRLQFTWQGCDSALAAPLVLDLVRLLAAASSAGVSGGIRELGYFFKDPWGSDEHRLERQYEQLVSWALALRATA